VGLRETIDDYWEIDVDGSVTRSVHVLPDGSVLRYDREHISDTLGALPEGTITDENLADGSYGVASVIAVSEFEEKWKLKAKNRE